MNENPKETIREDAMHLLRKLDPVLTYHSIDHTLDVVKQALRIAEAEHVSDKRDLMLLETACYFHDLGFLYNYKDHEEKSVAIFEEYAPRYGLSVSDKEIVCGMIMATKLPQQPNTKLQCIICDADLDYLGRSDFFSISPLLKKEFIHFHIVSGEAQWEHVQLNFLANHQYHCNSQQKLREPVLLEHLQILQGQYGRS